jgi:protein arginine kinase activator
MKCDICSKEATVFLTQIINGQMTTVNLCDGCAKEKGVTETTGFGLAEAFLNSPGGGADGASLAPAATLPTTAEACPACGFTYAQLRKIGRMGCPECYGAFRQGLDGLLSAMHKGTRHVGKTLLAGAAKPNVIWDRTQAEKMLERLKGQIQRAVASERYEDAAKFKAESDALQQQLSGRDAAEEDAL